MVQRYVQRENMIELSEYLLVLGLRQQEGSGALALEKTHR